MLPGYGGLTRIWGFSRRLNRESTESFFRADGVRDATVDSADGSTERALKADTPATRALNPADSADGSTERALKDDFSSSVVLVVSVIQQTAQQREY